MVMKIGYVQCNVRFGDKDYNLKHLDEYLSRIDDLDLIVFPELCNVGYAFDNRDQLISVAEQASSSMTINFFKEHARDLDTLIIAGFAERKSDAIYNSVAAVFPDGKVIIYRKTHLFYREKDLFTPGDTGFSVFEFRGVKISTIICFDWCFPETWRTLTLRGTQIVCMPSNLVLPGKAQKAVPVMCMMNRIFTLCVNRIGQEKDLKFTGRSLIANPEGEILCESPDDKEEYCRIEIDPEITLNKWMTPQNHVLNDRRPEFYEI